MKLNGYTILKSEDGTDTPSLLGPDGRSPKLRPGLRRAIRYVIALQFRAARRKARSL